MTITDSTREAVDAEQRLVDILNDACLALMLSVGHRTGLFTSLRGAGPVTVEALADAADLQPRYVREWLGAMTVGGIVAHDADAATYHLTDDLADLLTDDGSANLAAFAQYVAVLGGVEDDIVTCFHDGGGVPYERYPRFHEVMEADSGQTVVAALTDDILPLVDGLTQRLDEGIDVLDVGCGRARALRLLAERHPASRFVGLDLSEEAITHARESATGLSNLELRVGDAADLPAPWEAGSFDLVTTFDAIHDQASPAAVVRGIRAVLRDDGVYLAQDIKTSGTHAGDRDHPLGPFIYTISCLHCMTVSLARDGDGYGAAWGVPAAEQLLRDSGFGSVAVHELPHDPQNAYYVARR